MVDDRKIVETSYLLYVKHGIKSVSVDEIAAMLGISKKTLYVHIRSRDELLQLVIDYSLTQFIAGLRKLLEPEEHVFRKLGHLYSYIIKLNRKINPSFLPDLKKVNIGHFRRIQDFRNDQLFGFVKSIMEQGVQEELFRPDLDLRLVYLNQISKIDGGVLKGSPEYNQALFSNSIYKLIINDLIGMTTLKGHQEFEKQYDELLHLIDGYSQCNFQKTK